MEPRRGDKAAKPEFEDDLNKSIEEGLRFVLGESGLQMVLAAHSLESLSRDPATFHDTLKDIFMEGGAQIIEREIARRLLKKAGSERKLPGRSWLAEALSNAKTSRRVSHKEKEVLRGFLALASIPSAHHLGEGMYPAAMAGEMRSIELTAVEFAYAFRNGS